MEDRHCPTCGEPVVCPSCFQCPVCGEWLMWFEENGWPDEDEYVWLNEELDDWEYSYGW